MKDAPQLKTYLVTQSGFNPGNAIQYGTQPHPDSRWAMRNVG